MAGSNPVPVTTPIRHPMANTLTEFDRDRMYRDLGHYKELVKRKQAMLLVATTDERRNELRAEIQAHKEAISVVNTQLRESAL
jgi:hypothetical protein